MCELRRDEWLLLRIDETAMPTTLYETGIKTLHDQIVSLIAQWWAKAFHCKVTITTGSAQSLWTDAGQHKDIVSWALSPLGHAMQWIAEIETEDSLVDTESSASVSMKTPWTARASVNRKVNCPAQGVRYDGLIRTASIHRYPFP